MQTPAAPPAAVTKAFQLQSRAMPELLSWDAPRALRRALLRWYAVHARDLPWRRTRDPYAIWVAEIMLQQTRVAVVVDYYQRFLARFPDVGALARARLSSVLTLWSGLGYYRRARALHAAARAIVGERRGELPATSAAWRTLPGIGRYTAAAIASQAHGEPCAVVDGNVQRVLERLAGERLAGEAAWCAAGALLDPRAPGDFNQAMMELGATVCTPAQPQCSVCPVRRWCATRGVLERPPQPPRRKRVVGYALAVRDTRVRLVRRPADHALMPGLWELPPFSRTPRRTPAFTLRHAITTTDYEVRIFSGNGAPPRGKWIARSQLARLPLTGLARKALKQAGLLRLE